MSVVPLLAPSVAVAALRSLRPTEKMLKPLTGFMAMTVPSLMMVCVTLPTPWTVPVVRLLIVPELEPFNSNVPPARLIVPRLINGWLAPPGMVASSVALVVRVPSVAVSALVKLDKLTTSVPLLA